MLQHKPRHLGPGALRVGKIGRVKHHFKINPDGAGKSRGSRGEVGTLDPTFQMQLSLGKVVPFLVEKSILEVGLRCLDHCTKEQFENRFEIAPI